MKKKLILVLIALLMLILPAAALADMGGTIDTTVIDILIENAVNIAAAFFIALIGVFGAWLTAKLGKATQLDNVNHAQQELIKLAQITVGELKQTVVDGMKAAHKDGNNSRVLFNLSLSCYCSITKTIPTTPITSPMMSMTKSALLLVPIVLTSSGLFGLYRMGRI